MSLDCPKCKNSVGTLNLRESFTCSQCSAKLVGKFNGAFIWAIVLSTLADLVIYPIVYSNFGSNWWPGIAIRITVSTLVFIGLLALFTNIMGTIEVSNEQN